MRDSYNLMRSDGLIIIAIAWVGFWLLLSVLVRRARGKYIFLPTFADLQFSKKEQRVVPLRRGGPSSAARRIACSLALD